MSEPNSNRGVRLGRWLFAAYLLLYGVYMLLNAFWPGQMERHVVWGLNLAVVYGMGLILAALAMALVYAWWCRAGGGGALPHDPT